MPASRRFPMQEPWRPCFSGAKRLFVSMPFCLGLAAVCVRAVGADCPDNVTLHPFQTHSPDGCYGSC